MPAVSSIPVTPAGEHSTGYDLQVSLSEDFLNRVIAAAIASGALPSSFAMNAGFADDDIALTTKADLTLRWSDIALYSEAGQNQEIGIRAKWAGTLVIRITMAEWKISTAADSYTDPALDQTFTIPFAGDFAATADVLLKQLSDNQLLTVSFARLDKLDIARIGDLKPGKDFTEFVRLVIERIAVVALRKSFLFPSLNALAGSLPGPAGEILEARSAQIGATDFKVTTADDAGAPDEIQLLMQARQNLGQQAYQSVQSVVTGGGDIAIGVSTTLLNQLLYDFWLGSIIPYRLDDSGKLDPNGKVTVERVSFTTFDDGRVLIRGTARRDLIGIPVSLTASVIMKPVMSGGMLSVGNVDVTLDVNFDWAKAAGVTLVFLVLYEVIARLVLRGVADILEPVAESLLDAFLSGKTIDLRRKLDWNGMPFSADLTPTQLAITAREIRIAAALGLHV
jgi:hypothetical protein